MNEQQLLELAKPHLLKMIDIINTINVPMEGSLFFDDQILNVSLDDIKRPSLEKAVTLFEFATNKNDILEIGFNSGLSTLVFLLANDKVKVTSVDVMGHPYATPCYEYLKEVFKDRINVVQGDSVTILPIVLQTKSDFDGYFVDGGHSEDVVGSDFYNIIKYANNGVEICADDYYASDIRKVIHKHVNAGELEILVEYHLNVFLKLVK